MVTTRAPEVLLQLLNMTNEEMVKRLVNVSLHWGAGEERQLVPFAEEVAVPQPSANLSDAASCECGAPGWLHTGAQFYTQHVHGVAALTVCLIGALANILNLVVLTRRELRAAPVNQILCCLALADMLLMLEYVPFAYEMYLDPERARRKFMLPWALFLLSHMHFAQVLHTTSIMLTLLLASWRCLTLAQLTPSSPTRGGGGNRGRAGGGGGLTAALQSSKALIVALCACVLLPIVLCAPSFLCFTVKPLVVLKPPDPPHTMHLIVLSDLAHANGGALYHFHFWFYAVLVKLVPCLLLTALTACLIRALLRAHQHSQKLLRGSEQVPMITIEGTGNGGASSHRSQRASRRTDRTTRMLVAVTLLFLITEFPQGVLGVLSGIFGPCFFLTCYQLLGDILDMLALLNGAVNFVLYCAMSRQFRATFCRLFVPSVCKTFSLSRAAAAGATAGTGTIDQSPATTAIQAQNSEVNSTCV